jgi:hypothetical protein
MTWSTIAGAPLVTVSPLGISNGFCNLANNGANFGPDTYGTSTSGIQEALNAVGGSGGGTVKVLGGSFVINATIYTPGDHITVIFEPGTTLTMNGSYEFHMATDSSGNMHSWLRWIGHGTIVNLNDNVASIGETSLTAPTTAHHLTIRGFEVYSGQAPYFVAITNTTLTQTGADQQYGQILIEDLYLHSFANAGEGTGLLITNSNVTCRRVYIDGSTYNTSDDHSILFCHGGPENASSEAICENLLFEEVHVKNNGASGQVLELQGNGTSGASGILRNVTFNACIFDSGASSPVGAGSGGPFVDDNDSNTNSSYVYNIRFRDCKFVNCIMGYQSTSSQIGSITYEGYGPQSFSGSLQGRDGNGSSYTISITVGTSPFSYRNVDGCWEIVTVTGGTVSSITLNGISTGSTSGQFRLGPGDILTVTYSSAPTMAKTGSAG